MQKYLGITVTALLFSSVAWADVSEERSFSEPLAAGGRVSVDNINGEITVTGGSGDTVEITVVKKAGTQEYLDGIEVIITSQNNHLRIETKHPDTKGGWFNWGNDSSGSVIYTLQVPAGVNLDAIESVNGNIEISGVDGTVKAETINGRIEVTGLVSDASFETVNGTINASFDRLGGDQSVDAETVNGRITLELPENASARVRAETVNGGIDGEDFGLKTNKGFVGRDLDGTIGDGAAKVSRDTVNGAIRLRRN
jgi:hypothetical protein